MVVAPLSPPPMGQWHKTTKEALLAVYISHSWPTCRAHESTMPLATMMMMTGLVSLLS